MSNEMTAVILVGRAIIFLAGGLVGGYFAFFDTHELDGVKNANMYRISYFLVFLRGWLYFFFDVLKVLPFPTAQAVCQ